jgi:opacity protein-like surface antigen
MIRIFFSVLVITLVLFASLAQAQEPLKMSLEYGQPRVETTSHYDGGMWEESGATFGSHAIRASFEFGIWEKLIVEFSLTHAGLNNALRFTETDDDRTYFAMQNTTGRYRQFHLGVRYPIARNVSVLGGYQDTKFVLTQTGTFVGGPTQGGSGQYTIEETQDSYSPYIGALFTKNFNRISVTGRAQTGFWGKRSDSFVDSMDEGRVPRAEGHSTINWDYLLQATADITATDNIGVLVGYTFRQFNSPDGGGSLANRSSSIRWPEDLKFHGPTVGVRYRF